MKANSLLQVKSGVCNTLPERVTLHYSVILMAAILIMVFLSPPVSAQVPHGFNYQALATDASGELLRNEVMTVQFTFLTDTNPDIVVWRERHLSVSTNQSGLLTLVAGTGQRHTSSAVPTFADIIWGVPQMFLRTEIYYNNQWRLLGTSRLWSVPYAASASQISGSVRNLLVAGITEAGDEALFEVKNKNGEIVFAVYNEGVRINVGEGDVKASKSGFAIGSFDRTKAEITDLLVVNRDSVRVYLDNNATKAIKGGFAIGSFDRTKGISQNYFNVTGDSVRVYIDDTVGKASKGGFAIGSFDRTKTGTNSYFDVSPASASVINPSEPRILWYPLKNAFLAGQVLIEDREAVGENSMAIGYETKASGDYSQAMGYRAHALGYFSTAIGQEALAERSNSFALGQFAQAKANESYAFGRGAVANGYRSFAFGSAGVDSLEQNTGNTAALGNYSFAMGMGSVSEGLGSVTLGLADTARGSYSVAIGYRNSALAYGSVAMGNQLVASHPSEIIVGRYNALPDADTDPWGNEKRLFVVGAGLRNTIRLNAMTILANRDTWFNGNIHLYGSTRYFRFSDSHGVMEVSSPNSHLYFRVGGTGTPANRMVINGETGYVGVGVSSTGITHILHINGEGRSSSSTWATSSDARVKENINTVEGALEKILQLQPVEYNYTGEYVNGGLAPKGKQTGFLAQDVESVMPELVSIVEEKYDGNTIKDFRLLNQGPIVPLLVSAVKEQQQIIESQATALEQQNLRIDSLEDQLSQLLQLLSQSQSSQDSKKPMQKPKQQ